MLIVDSFGFLKVMLGVDRLDMIKGIPQRLLAFEKFLEENPKWHDKVALVQIAVPTRTDVPECKFIWWLSHRSPLPASILVFSLCLLLCCFLLAQ